MNSREKARANKQLYIAMKGGVCLDCGGSFHPCCFHFDHRDVITKTFNLSDQMHWDYERVKEELDKRDLVCANCHALRTFIHNREQISLKQGAGQRGKKRSAEVRARMSAAQVGRFVSAESRAKQSAKMMGRTSVPAGWNHTPEAIEKMRNSAIVQFRNGRVHHNQGKKLSEETRKKISDSLKARSA